MELLPGKVWRRIMRYLNSRDLNALALVSRRCCAIANDDPFWRHEFKRRFGRVLRERYDAKLFRQKEILLSNVELQNANSNGGDDDDDVERLKWKRTRSQSSATAAVPPPREPRSFVVGRNFWRQSYFKQLQKLPPIAVASSSASSSLLSRKSKSKKRAAKKVVHDSAHTSSLRALAMAASFSIRMRKRFQRQQRRADDGRPVRQKPARSSTRSCTFDVVDDSVARRIRRRIERPLKGSSSDSLSSAGNGDGAANANANKSRSTALGLLYFFVLLAIVVGYGYAVMYTVADDDDAPSGYRPPRYPREPGLLRLDADDFFVSLSDTSIRDDRDCYRLDVYRSGAGDSDSLDDNESRALGIVFKQESANELEFILASPDARFANLTARSLALPAIGDSQDEEFEVRDASAPADSRPLALLDEHWERSGLLSRTKYWFQVKDADERVLAYTAKQSAASTQFELVEAESDVPIATFTRHRSSNRFLFLSRYEYRWDVHFHSERRRQHRHRQSFAHDRRMAALISSKLLLTNLATEDRDDDDSAFL
jgi:F-box-like